MINKNKIESLILTSKYLGKRKEFIQGAGGNTSIKLNKNVMAIKSSGIKLKKMSKIFGYTLIDYKSLNLQIKNNKKIKNNFSSIINEVSNPLYKRASIETGFHSILGSAVIHTHSVYINTILCSEEGKKIISQLFPEYYWVKYFTPGIDVTLKINELAKDIKNIKKKNIVFFLENHGVIVSSKNFTTAKKIHTEINNKIINKFALSSFNKYKFKNNLVNIKKIIFPDQLIFSKSIRLRKTLSGIENLKAAMFIKNEIERIKLTPKFLNQKSIETLLNMESEKYRQKIA